MIQWNSAFCCQGHYILKTKHFGCDDLFTTILQFHISPLILATESQPERSKWGMMNLGMWQARAFYRVLPGFSSHFISGYD